MRVVLKPGAAKPSGEYLFRLYERMDRVRQATLLLRGSLTVRDELEVLLNGVPMAPGPLGQRNARFLEMAPAVRWFPVPPDAVAYGQNQLTISLVEADSQTSADIVIDEVELWIQPK